MRPRLSLLTDRRHEVVPRRTSGPSPRPRGADSQPRPRAADTATDPQLRADLLAPDADFCRAREAGGPEDTAQYSCSCGYQFAAEVSTSVDCPHCGTPQAW